MSEKIHLETLDFIHSEIVAGLHHQAFDENWSAKEFQDLIALSASFGFLALKGDEPVGFVLCQGDHVEAEIITIACAPTYRRQGVATALLRQIIESTRRLFLEVAEDNDNARLFYAENGFETIGRRPKYYKRPDGMRCDALVMQRDMS